MKLTIKIVQKKRASLYMLNDWFHLIKNLPRTKKRTDTLKKITKYAIAYIEKKPIAIACIKKPQETYRNYLSKKIWIKSIPKYELWYCYSNKKYRNKGIARKLIWKLINNDLFATTKEDNIPIQRILKKYNFKRNWKPFQSKLGKYNIIFMRYLTKSKKQLK